MLKIFMLFITMYEANFYHTIKMSVNFGTLTERSFKNHI